MGDLIKNFREVEHARCSTCRFFFDRDDGTWGCERDPEFSKEWFYDLPHEYVCDGFERLHNWAVYRVMAKGYPTYTAAQNRTQAKQNVYGNAKEMLGAVWTELKAKKIMGNLSEADAVALAKRKKAEIE